MNAHCESGSTYVGSSISNHGDVRVDINSRLGKAGSIFQKLNSIWSSKHTTLNTKVKLFKSLVIPVAIFASETWKMTSEIVHKLDVFQQRCLRYCWESTGKTE